MILIYKYKSMSLKGRLEFQKRKYLFARKVVKPSFTLRNIFLYNCLLYTNKL